MAARAASGFAAAEFKSAEQEADVELARQMEALDKELTLLEQESMDRKAEEEERRVAEETENKRRQAEEERLRQAEQERLARVEELQRKVEEERLRAQEEAAEEERRREEDRRAKARAQEEEMQAREALARKKRLAEDLAVRKHSLDKAEELKRMAEDERKREELWRKQQEAESQRIEIEARTKAEQAQQEATASAKKREEERRLAAATEETEDAHLRRPESWPRRQVQGADQQLEATEREGEQHRRTRPDAHALRRQEVEAAAELARHDVEMFIQKEITGKEKVFRERAMMQHFKHAEAAFHESYAACARRDYIGAAAMRETAFQQYGLYSSLGGDAEPGFVEALHELGEEIRNIAQQSLAMQRETARQAHAKAAAAHAAAREAEATEINQIRLREQEEREDEQARQEGRPSPRRGRYGQTPPRNHPSALSEDHQAALSQVHDRTQAPAEQCRPVRTSLRRAASRRRVCACRTHGDRARVPLSLRADVRVHGVTTQACDMGNRRPMRRQAHITCRRSKRRYVDWLSSHPPFVAGWRMRVHLASNRHVRELLCPEQLNLA